MFEKAIKKIYSINILHCERKTAQNGDVTVVKEEEEEKKWIVCDATIYQMILSIYVYTPDWDRKLFFLETAETAQKQTCANTMFIKISCPRNYTQEINSFHINCLCSIHKNLRFLQSLINCKSSKFPSTLRNSSSKARAQIMLQVFW